VALASYKHLPSHVGQSGLASLVQVKFRAQLGIEAPAGASSGNSFKHFPVVVVGTGTAYLHTSNPLQPLGK
jgi:hypothetical protein